MTITEPAVQVVTVSDWPAIVTGLVTGALGLVGILVAYRQGKRAEEAATKNLLRSIDAENERARLTGKRHAYAAFHAALNNFYEVGRSAEDLHAEPGRSEFSNAWAAVLNTNAEATLIAPKKIDKLMVQVTDMFKNHVAVLKRNRSAPFPDELGHKRDELFDAMRADLGEAS